MKSNYVLSLYRNTITQRYLDLKSFDSLKNLQTIVEQYLSTLIIEKKNTTNTKYRVIFQIFNYETIMLRVFENLRQKLDRRSRFDDNNTILTFNLVQTYFDFCV